MIGRVTIRHFKRFRDQTFDLAESVVLAGPNNAGKSTLLQAIATWKMGLDRWVAQRGGSKAATRSGVSITRNDFTAVPLREMNLLWEDRKVTGPAGMAGAPRPIEIVVRGKAGEATWNCGMEFQYANRDLVYARPRGAKDLDREAIRNFPPAAARDLGIVHVPPLSGIERDEPRRDRGMQDLLVGQGRPGEILRNLLLEIAENDPKGWMSLREFFKDLFRIDLLEPDYSPAQPYIVCEYREPEHSRPLDLSNAGSGTLQVLLLLAFLYARPATVILLDEPDAHQHVILQRQVYDLLRKVARDRGGQVVMATHSEVVIDATEPTRVLAFLGQEPRPLTDRNERDRLREALKRVTTTLTPESIKALIEGGETLAVEFKGEEARPFSDRELDYSALRLDGVGTEALDPLEFERFRRMIRENRSRGDAALLELSDLDLAKALGAVECGNGEVSVRVLGLLLFGRTDALASMLPAHEVAFQALSGTEVEVNDFFRWPLLRVMEELESRFRAHNREREILVGMVRIGVPHYPERAFREGVANALIHRDYTSLGAVHVQWREDRMEISNPGGFPSGVRLDNLLVTGPRPRNPLLADAFKRAGIVERTARGIDTIFHEQLRNGRPAPSYERSTEAGVTLTLPGGQPDLDFVRLAAEEGRQGRPLSPDELLLLNALEREPRLTTVRAAATIQRGKGEAEAVLRKLCERGIVEARGAAPRQTFRLSEAAVRRLGGRRDAGGGRGASARHDEKIRRYVEAHGSISRREAAELCAIDAPQAYRLLKKMETDGVLRRVRTNRRDARYERNA